MSDKQIQSLKNIHNNITILHSLATMALTPAMSIHGNEQVADALYAISLIANDLENAKEELEEFF